MVPVWRTTPGLSITAAMFATPAVVMPLTHTRAGMSSMNDPVQSPAREMVSRNPGRPGAVQEGEFVVQRNSGVAVLGQEHAAASAERVEAQQLQPLLIAALALHGDAVAVREPVDAR